MLRIYASITQDHDLRLVFVAALICALTTYTAVGMLQRSVEAQDAAHPWRANPWRWLALAAIAAGAGKWSTHFVAMLAFKPDVPIGYAPGLTLLSIAIAVALCAAGLAIAARRPGQALLGGAVLGSGIGAMHYVSVAAMQIQATVHWNATYVCVSLVIGTMFGALALWRATTAPGVHGRLQGAMLLVFGIFGLHFTAMAAMSLEPDVAPLPLPEGLAEPASLAVSIAGAAFLIIMMGQVWLMLSRRAVGRA